MENEHLALIHYLVDEGCDINEKNKDGRTYLSMARRVADESRRLELLAALHRRPPPPTLMSEGRSNSVWHGIFITRSILACYREYIAPRIDKITFSCYILIYREVC